MQLSMDNYSEFLSQKLFLIEYEAMRYLNSSSIEELKGALKEIINISTGSPSYIKGRRAQ